MTRAIADEQALGAYVTAALRRFPDQRPLLAGLAERQRLHVTRFRDALTEPAAQSNRGRPSLPRSSAALKPALADLVLGARNARSADCAAATSGLLAELFASAAASHAMTVQSLEPGSAAPVAVVPDAVTSARGLQQCLAAEHAAVFGYALLGGVLSAAVSEAPAAKAAVTSYDVHRDRRDVLTELIAAAGTKPAAAEAAYDIPFPVAGEPSARRLARYLEARCATVYARSDGA